MTYMADEPPTEKKIPSWNMTSESSSRLQGSGRFEEAASNAPRVVDQSVPSKKVVSGRTRSCLTFGLAPLRTWFLWRKE